MARHRGELLDWGACGAMGATYPIAVASARAHRERRRTQPPTTTAAGGPVCANSAGAAAGAMAAGFWLIEFLGIRGTTWVAVALNVGAASLALWSAGRNDCRRQTGLTGPPKGRHYGRPRSRYDGRKVGNTYSRGRRSKQPNRITSAPQPALAAARRRSQDSPLSCTRSRGRG